MKDKMLEESLNNFYRTFLIWVIRCYPILFCLAILVHQCEVIHSVGTGDIIEYYDGDTLEYIQYATPFSDKYLTIFFNAKLFNAILFYVLSKVFLFCIYHRVFVIEMLIYAILDIVFNNVVFEDAHLINAIYYTSIGFVTVGFLLHYTCIKDMEIGKCTRIKLSVMGIGVVISNLFFTHSLCSSRILHVYLDLYGRCLFI